MPKRELGTWNILFLIWISILLAQWEEFSVQLFVRGRQHKFLFTIALFLSEFITLSIKLIGLTNYPSANNDHIKHVVRHCGCTIITNCSPTTVRRKLIGYWLKCTVDRVEVLRESWARRKRHEMNETRGRVYPSRVYMGLSILSFTSSREQRSLIFKLN